MESDLLKNLRAAVAGTQAPQPFDARGKFARNSKGKKWSGRDPEKLKGLVWHQELGWGSVESVAEYHTGPDSHVYKGGVESISYSLAIRRNGQIVLCNDLDRATWSQGYASRPGDENAEFLSVMFEGFFRGEGVTDPSAGEPNNIQLTSGMLLWNCCKEIWEWNDDDLFGHYHFGKPACPGNTLKAVIEATRAGSAKPSYDFNTVLGRQEALIALGFYKETADGVWGPASKGALTRFQAKNGLVADGVWGPNTEAAVVKALKGR